MRWDSSDEFCISSPPSIHHHPTPHQPPIWNGFSQICCCHLLPDRKAANVLRLSDPVLELVISFLVPHTISRPWTCLVGLSCFSDVHNNSGRSLPAPHPH